MSGHSPLRQDKTCLNCRHVVEKRYCPNCGQENTDSRKTFHHLFIHFFEDLTHYENAFWKTIRHLLFKPGRLTKEYLSGKRLSYLAPVRLYIFISFVTFFIISVLPSDSSESENSKGKAENSVQKQAEENLLRREIEISSPADTTTSILVKKDGKLISVAKTDLESQQLLDSAKGDRVIDFPSNEAEASKVLAGLDSSEVKTTTQRRYLNGFGGFNSEAELDSIQNSRPEGQKMSGLRYRLEKVLARIHEKSEDEDFARNFTEAFLHNVPKALFLYMPIFAFWLWAFHGKKRWYYFDHGIFTLHYFSFMLLTLCSMLVLTAIVNQIDVNALTAIVVFMWFALFGWWFFYFFRSHSRFYGESKAISRLKSLALYFINMWLITFFTLGLLAYTILYMH